MVLVEVVLSVVGFFLKKKRWYVKRWLAEAPARILQPLARPPPGGWQLLPMVSAFILSSSSCSPSAFKKIIVWNIFSQWDLICSASQTSLGHLTGEKTVLYGCEMEAGRDRSMEEPLHVPRNAESQSLSSSAPETWFLNLFNQETGPWHCTEANFTLSL